MQERAGKAAEAVTERPREKVEEKVALHYGTAATCTLTRLPLTNHYSLIIIIIIEGLSLSIAITH